jgi:hypothetical protein
VNRRHILAFRPNADSIPVSRTHCLRSSKHVFDGHINAAAADMLPSGNRARSITTPGPSARCHLGHLVGS